jgi:vanillate O-demethylase monooxygenase subunit
MSTMPRQLTNTDAALRHGWHPVALASEVGDEPVAVRLLGEPWALTRLDDRLEAFADRCPRRRAPRPAGPVERHDAVCAYHGWRFVTSGACTAVPSSGPGGSASRGARAAPPWGITERYGIVWLAPDEPFADIIDLPEDGDPDFDSAWLPVARTSACAGVLTDDLLGAAGAGRGHGAAARCRVEADGDGFRVRTERAAADGARVPGGPGVPGLRTLVRRRGSDCVFRPPFMLRLRFEYPEAQTTCTVLCCLQPEDDGVTRVYTRILRDDLRGDERRLAEAVRSEQAVVDGILATRGAFAAGGLPLACADAADAERVGPRAHAAGVALRRVLAAFASRAERTNAPGSPDSRPAKPPRPRYARRPSVLTGRC